MGLGGWQLRRAGKEGGWRSAWPPQDVRIGKMPGYVFVLGVGGGGSVFREGLGGGRPTVPTRPGQGARIEGC